MNICNPVFALILLFILLSYLKYFLLYKTILTI